jgi:MFS superfamily sulfate permease-like transporter
LVAWAFRLSVLVKLISDSVLVGFKAGAELTIAITQLPALSGVTGGGRSVPVYRPRFLGHRIEPYAAVATG